MTGEAAANECEPDGYAVLLDDPKGKTPGDCGYWYIGAYRTEGVAKGVADRNKGARVVPMYFGGRPERADTAELVYRLQRYAKEAGRADAAEDLALACRLLAFGRLGIDMPAELHPTTKQLVLRFAQGTRREAAQAELKYGYDDSWTGSAWEGECRRRLYEHLEKGDPRDVANYCAFMWHHGWNTKRAPSHDSQAKDIVTGADGGQW